MSQDDNYSLKKVAELFGGMHLKERIEHLETLGEIPLSQKVRVGALYRKVWKKNDLPEIGKKIGFFKKFSTPVAVCVFTTKGGVLKSTMALNLARTAALHGMKTCVVGLDIQGDVTMALGHECEIEENEYEDELKNLIARLDSTIGLCDLFSQRARLEDLIVTTDLEGLCLIPETPELVALNDGLNNINRREFWLKEKVIDRLKESFDFIVMDCSPNWNKLTTNALVAADVLVSPLECKINNFRNFKVFRYFLSEFRKDMRVGLETVFVPTRYARNKKLGMDIFQWYQDNVVGCTTAGLRESVASEEATALHKSLLEHDPSSDVAKEVRELLIEVHARIEQYLEYKLHVAHGMLHVAARADGHEKQAIF